MDQFEAASPLMFIQRGLFNILVSERRVRPRELHNKGKIMREFDTLYLVVVSKQVKSSRKYSISHKLVFKTKVPYRVLEKSTPRSYWIQRLYFCQVIGRPGRKVKGSSVGIEKIPSNMVLHKHVYGGIHHICHHGGWYL